MKQYDFLIVGAGLFGAVFANEMRKIGRKCLVIDKRHHTGGNTYCQTIDDINVHYYGAHIFHTNSKAIWNYVNSFVEFNRYTNSPLAFYKDNLYNLPFNMNTFYQLWGVKSPEDAMSVISEQTQKYKVTNPTNLEDYALSLVGLDIYEKLIKGYSEKQWGRPANELPSSILKRLPLRYTYDNNYFNDKYQGIPIGGYNKLIEGLLKNVTVKLDVDFFDSRSELAEIADRIVFTGKIDEYYNYQFGQLEYRSLRFEHIHLPVNNYQGNAVVNYTDHAVPFTRIIEHKHFEYGTQASTVITKEFPAPYNRRENEAYYPVNDDMNNRIYQKYRDLSLKEDSVLFGGRLAEFKYYDMHQIIASSLKAAQLIVAKLRT